MLYSVASAVKGFPSHVDDDVIDKLNYYYTSSILTILAIVVSSKQYVGHPIQCWVPATFTDPMEQYTENYCWVQNTYYVTIDEEIPREISTREAKQLGYYQWVPFILALEALLFYMPCLLWRLLSSQAGIQVQNVVQMACDCRFLDTEGRKRAIETISNQLEDTLHLYQASAKNTKPITRLGTSVTFLYMCMKLLYCCNGIAQLFMLNFFLGNTPSSMYGFYVMKDLLRGKEWEESGNFPRVTWCDFQVKVLGNIHRHTVQCVLMINMFNEKIFLFLWYWFILLIGASFLSMLHWLYVSVMPGRRLDFVSRYLTGMGGYRMVDSQSLRRFVFNYLQGDGVFVLRMAATHAGELVCSDLAKALWTDFIDSQRGEAS